MSILQLRPRPLTPLENKTTESAFHTLGSHYNSVSK